MKINVPDSAIWNEGIVNEELAVACLLADDICFLNHTKDSEPTTCIYVLANDVFAWGCADAESITNNDWKEPSEIIDLYKLWKENDKWGPIKWLCLKRNKQPQKPIKEDMIKDGYWDEKLESLPENYYWKKIKENYEQKQNTL